MGERLSSIEAIMWRTGHDATLRMIVGTLMITDRSPTEKGLLERLEALVERAPRLRWRLDDPNGTRTRPGWVPNAEFNAANHLRTMAVAAPGYSPSGPRSRRVARTGAVRPRPGPLGRDLDRGARGRASRDLPPCPSRPHRRLGRCVTHGTARRRGEPAAGAHELRGSPRRGTASGDGPSPGAEAQAWHASTSTST